REAARAVGDVLPALAGKLGGMAMRVPIPDGSIVDLVTILKREATAEEINGAIREATGTERLRNVLKYSEAPIVSSDIVGDPHSSIFDGPFTQVLDGCFVKTMSWYDNEWGYSNRVVDLLKRLDDLG
ncbi:MAG: type I glyceraldehyde-3-phosphate dehydrogenase, partial [Acidobacteriota bacterium]